jgi:hypothetical protein
MNVNLDDRAAVEAVLNNSPCTGEFVGTGVLDRKDAQQEPSAKAAFEALMNAPATNKPIVGSVAVSLEGGGEIGFHIAHNPYAMHPEFGPQFVTWAIKAAKANSPGGPLHNRWGLNLGQHVPPEFSEIPAELLSASYKKTGRSPASLAESEGRLFLGQMWATPIANRQEYLALINDSRGRCDSIDKRRAVFDYVMTTRRGEKFGLEPIEEEIVDAILAEATYEPHE